jgi:hypothetical protein
MTVLVATEPDSSAVALLGRVAARRVAVGSRRPVRGPVDLDSRRPLDRRTLDRLLAIGLAVEVHDADHAYETTAAGDPLLPAG